MSRTPNLDVLSQSVAVGVRRGFISALLLTVLAPGIAGSDGYPAHTGVRESRYEIFSHGLRVGDLTTIFSHTVHNDRKALRFESKTRVKADLLVFAVAYDSHETAVVTEQGTVSYRRTDRRKGKQLDAIGRLEGGRFILEVNENGVRRSLSFDRSRYDHTTMECPETLMSRVGEEKSERLLDFESLSVITRQYRWVKNEEVIVEGRPILCRVIDFEDPHKRGRRWIKADDLGVIIARQDGKGKDGSYSLRMTRLRAGS